MSAWTHPPVETSPDDAQPCGGEDASALLSYQMALLRRLADVGMNLVLAIERQATQTSVEAASEDGSAQAKPAHVFQGDLILAYDRVSRSVRMTLALQSRLMAAHQDQDKAARERARMAGYGRRDRIGRIVERVAKAESEGQSVKAMVRETAERLDDGELYGDVMNRPVSEIIAEICRDQGLNPDWTFLAREGWAREEIISGLVGPPLAAFAARGQQTPPPRPIPGPYWPAPPSPPSPSGLTRGPIITNRRS